MALFPLEVHLVIHPATPGRHAEDPVCVLTAQGTGEQKPAGPPTRVPDGQVLCDRASAAMSVMLWSGWSMARVRRTMSFGFKFEL